MRSSSLSLLPGILVLAVMAIPLEVRAALPGQPCPALGKTVVSDDKQDMMACLNDSSHNLVWTGLAVQPRSASPDANFPTPLAHDAQPAPTLSPQARWQGWYVGGNVGMANTTNSYGQTSDYTTDVHTYGGTAGLVGGYNQIESNGLFFGGEADANYISNANGSTATYTRKDVWHEYATVRGRVGMAFDPAIVFLTGGLALANVSNRWNSQTEISFLPYKYANFGYYNTRVEEGWTVGAGAEFALTENISMNAQYLMLEMPQRTEDAVDINGTHHKFLLNDSANILRVGLNWHFD